MALDQTKKKSLEDMQAETLDKVSSFGKGKLVTESEKMIMAKNKPVAVKKTIKVMKKPVKPM